MHALVEHLCRSVGPATADLTDAQLLDRYAHDQDQAAFEVLVWRHGTMVLNTCRRLLRDTHQAEDAFQATFLILARKAASIGKGEAVAGWLYQVAYRVSLRAKARVVRQPGSLPTADQQLPALDGDASEAALLRELRLILDEEVHRLPAKYRTPFVLHYLQGKTCEAVGQVIGTSKGAVSLRLSKARELLQKQLTRRGIALSAGMLALLETEAAAASVTAGLVQATVQVARKFTTVKTAAGLASGEVIALAEGTLNAMTTSKWKVAAVILLAVIGFGGVGTVSYQALAGKPPANIAAAQGEPVADAREPLGNDPNNIPQARKLFRVDHHGEPLPPGALARMGKLQIAPQARVRFVAFSADGKSLVSYGQTPHKWDAFTGKEIDTSRDVAWPVLTYSRYAFSPDGKMMALSDTLHRSNDADGVKLMDLTTGQETRLQAHKGEEYVRFLAFSPDGRWFASVGGLYDKERKDKAPSKVRVWDVATGTEVRAFEGGGPLAFSPDSKSLVIGVLPAEDYAGSFRYEPFFSSIDSDEQVIKIADLATGKITRELGKVAVKGFTHSLVFSPDGQTLAYLGVKGESGTEELLLWDLVTGRERRQFIGLFPEKAAGCFTFSPDGKTLATACRDGTVRLWEVATGKERQPFKGHIGFVECLAFSPDGRRLASGSQDTTILVWDVTGHVAADRRLPARLSPQELDRLWKQLASGEAIPAYEAMWSGVAASKQIVPMLDKFLQSVAAPTPKQLEQLVADLDHAQFEQREKTERELERLGELAAPSLEKLLGGNPPLEVRQRAEQLLRRLSGPVTHAEVLRHLRAIELLEHLGTADAQKVLQAMAGGVAEARVTREAKAALERLRKR